MLFELHLVFDSTRCCMHRVRNPQIIISHILSLAQNSKLHPILDKRREKIPKRSVRVYNKIFRRVFQGTTIRALFVLCFLPLSTLSRASCVAICTHILSSFSFSFFLSLFPPLSYFLCNHRGLSFEECYVAVFHSGS